MAVKKILLVGNDLLYEKSKSLDFERDDIASLLKDLKDTLQDFMLRKKLGRGISGPQIGVLKQAIYIIENGEHLAFVNPQITSHSREKMMVWDSCFCYDVELFVLVGRYRDIAVEFQTPTGVKREMSFTGPLSELLQHEIDHLNGILSYQRLKNPKRMMRRIEWEAHGSPYIISGWKQS
jgi:peptide deformylase